jgi:CHAT domain
MNSNEALYELEVFRQLLSAISNLRTAKYQSKAIDALLPYLPSQLLPEALIVAGAINNLKYRKQALSALVQNLSSDLLLQALALTRCIEDTYVCASVLAALVPYLPNSQIPQVVNEALDAARQIQPNSQALINNLHNINWHTETNPQTESGIYRRAEVLIAIVPHVPSQVDQIVAEALEAMEQLEYQYYHADFLKALAPYLQLDSLTRAIAIIEASDNYYRRQAWIGLVENLPNDLVLHSLVVARNLNDADVRAQVLTALVPRLPIHIVSEVITEIFQATQQTDNYYSKEVLAGLVPYLTADFLPEAIATIAKIAHYERSQLISSIRHLIPEKHLEVLAVTRSIENAADRADILTALIPFLPVNLVSEVVAEIFQSTYQIETYNNGYFRSEALKILAPYVTQDLLPEAIAIIAGIDDSGYSSKEYREKALIALSQHLKPDLVLIALEVILGIENPKVRAELLTVLLFYLPKSQMHQVVTEIFQAIQQINSDFADNSRVEKLAALLPYLSPDLLLEALTIARGIEDATAHAQILTTLIPYLPENLVSEVVTEIFQAIQQITSDYGDYSRVQFLKSLLPYLSPDLLLEALIFTRNIEGATTRAKLLAVLIPYLPTEIVSEVVSEIFQAIQQITSDYSDYVDRSRSQILTALIPHLPSEFIPGVLAKISEINNSDSQGALLNDLLLHLPPHFLSNAFTIARGIQNTVTRAGVLANLFFRVEEEERIQIFEELLTTVASILASEREIPDVIYEATAINFLRSQVNLLELLIQIALYLPDYESHNAIVKIIDVGRELFNDEWVNSLSIAVILPPVFLQKAVQAAVEGRAEPRYTNCSLGTSELFVLVRIIASLQVKQQENDMSTITSKYAQASFPERVPLGTINTLSVAITISQLNEQFVSLALRSNEPLQVDIVPIISESDFTLEGANVQTLEVLPDRDSNPVMFNLIPLQEGEKIIKIAFFQNLRYLGELVLNTTVFRGKFPSESNPPRQLELPPSHPPSERIKEPDLTILVHREQSNGNTYRYQYMLISPIQELHICYQKFHSPEMTQIPLDFLNETFDQINQMYLEQDGNADDQNLRLHSIGIHLYDCLFPDDLKRLYWETLRHRVRSILIISDEPWIPWELICPVDPKINQLKDGFLCERFELTRWLAGKHTYTNTISLDNLALIVPASDLESAALEAKEIQALPGINARYIEPPSRSQFNRLLQEGNFSALHFAGHAQHNQRGAVWSKLILEEGSTLSPIDINGDNLGFCKNNPFIFLNACETAQSGYTLTGMGGWAEAFIQRGRSSGFIGSIWQANDDSARLFAVTFYKKLLEGHTIASAAQSARIAIKKPNDPTWLSYSVYANPLARLSTISEDLLVY